MMSVPNNVTSSNHNAGKYPDIPKWVFKKCVECKHSRDVQDIRTGKLYCVHTDMVLPIDFEACRNFKE